MGKPTGGYRQPETTRRYGFSILPSPSTKNVQVWWVQKQVSTGRESLGFMGSRHPTGRNCNEVDGYTDIEIMSRTSLQRQPMWRHRHLKKILRQFEDIWRQWVGQGEKVCVPDDLMGFTPMSAAGGYCLETTHIEPALWSVLHTVIIPVRDQTITYCVIRC